MNPQNLKFSLIIPTYNRPERLKKCLQSIANLDYPRDRFEVMVVDSCTKMTLKFITEKSFYRKKYKIGLMQN